MAGVPFEILRALSTPQAAQAARELLVRQGASTESSYSEVFDEEFMSARQALLKSSRDLLPPYLVFAGSGVRELLSKLLASGSGEWLLSPQRNARAGDRERRLILYLQRVCGKNDTFSKFGPSAWGRIEALPELTLSVAEPVTKREVFFERWTAQTLTAAINADPLIKSELAPRIDPNGKVEGEDFFLTQDGQRIRLTLVEIELLARCDGRTPAHSLGVPHEILQDLATRKILRWEMEVPALDAHAFEVLVSDISAWRESDDRKRWLEVCEPLLGLVPRFREQTDTAQRVEIIGEARDRLEALGGVSESSQRFLYAATNPLGEECARDSSLVLPEAMAAEFTRDAAPWIDLWRDTYAFVAHRVAAGLRGLLRTAPITDGALPLPAFLKHCATQNMPLTGHGIVALAHIAFQEVKAAFREELGAREDARELRLTEAECHFVRRRFEYERFDEYTYPSADLQISAGCLADIAGGKYEWVVSEFHPPIALLHHCFYWSCPDRAALSRALAATTFGKPSFYYGFFAADFTAHTVVRWIEALPDLMHFVAPKRPHANWKCIPPSETEVFTDEANGDVCLRRCGSREYLGSFARSWIIPLGFHPFHFGRPPHTPRLRCGNVIVQRESWTVKLEEFPAGNHKGVSRSLVLAVEKLRAKNNLPRYVYIRPTEQALRRSGAEGRDKDTKPVFIDFESYLFLEIFYRWLVKAAELEVTEMLPDPDHLFWQEADGHRTFELRTQIVPR